MARKAVLLSPAEITAKWQNRSINAVPDIVKSVNAVQDSPMEAAIAKKDKMLAGITRAVNDGTWEAGLRKVSLPQWKEKTVKKVQERYAGGVQAATDKHRAFADYLVTTVNAGMAKVDGMPDLTLQDSINRMGAFVTHMAQNRYRKA